LSLQRHPGFSATRVHRASLIILRFTGWVIFDRYVIFVLKIDERLLFTACRPHL
jgi:hypothetical protein